MDVSASGSASGAPALAVSAQGQVQIAWHDYGPGAPDILVVGKAIGAPWTAVENASQTTRYSRYPRLAVDSQGTLHLVWEDDSFSGGPTDILYSARAADGSWSSPTTLSDSAVASLNPMIAVGDDDTIHITWAEYTGITYDILYTRLMPGTDWMPVENVSAGQGYSAHPAIALDSQGQPHLAWENHGGGNYEIFHSQRLSDGVWTSPSNVSRSAGDATRPRLAIDSIDAIHIVWQDTTLGAMNVYYVLGAPDGTWSDVQPIHTSHNPVGAPALAVDPERNVYVFWAEGGQILYSKRALGTTWLAPQQGPASAQAAGALDLVMQENVLYLTWVDDQSGSTEIHYARKGPGRSWSLPWNVTASEGFSQHCDALVDEHNVTHLVWEDNRSGRFAILYSYRPFGGDWVVPKMLSDGPRDAASPAIVRDRAGTLHTLWEESGAEQGGIYYVSKPTGGGWSAPINIAAGQNAAEMPALALDGSDTVHAVWKGLAANNYEIMYANKPPGGGWSAPLNLSLNSGYSSDPALIIDAQDTLHVVWSDSTPGNRDIFYAYHAAGAGWSIINNLTANAGSSSQPTLALDHNGLLHLLWRDNVDGSFDIYALSQTAQGWGEPFNVSITAAASGAPDLLIDGDNVLHAFWEDQTPGHYEIFYANRRPNGDWTEAIDISNTTAPSNGPTAILFANGELGLFWHEGIDVLDADLFFSLRLNARPYGPIDLRTDSQVDPTGISIHQPRLSWSFFDPDHGDLQSAFRVLVASSRELIEQRVGDLCDTGKVDSPQTEIVYPGLALDWATTYYWSLQTWDSSDLAGDLAAPATFTTSRPPQPSTDLYCDGESAPTRLTTRVPTLSWQFQDVDTGAAQTAFQILVASSLELAQNAQGDIWDSGHVASATSAATYAGPTLAWGTTYYWTVKCWDEHDLEGTWSAPGSFRLMALPDPPHRPQCEGETNPSGIVNLTPSLSWTFHDDDPGDQQTAYRILVAASISDLQADVGTLWDSGKVISGQMRDISYQGAALTWNTAYCWKVCTWDGLDAQGPYTPAQFFTTNGMPTAPTYPTCDSRTSEPLFSWDFSDPNTGDQQSAYRILVASSEILLNADLGDLWDSGKITSDQSAEILYQGQPLAWRQTYYWKVKTWDRHDFAGPFCTTQVFALDTPPLAPLYPLCEGQSNPRGIWDSTPKFTWSFADPDAADQQGAYQILVASSSAHLDADIGDLWDSGRVLSSLSADISYDGHPLSWKKRYYWKVRTWDRLGAASPYCAVQTFTMNAPPNRPLSPLCEGRANPGALSVTHPTFAWTFVDNDQGDTQGAYQLLVASSLTNLHAENGDLWDSGKINSASMQGIVYDGQLLAKGTTYYWAVKTWDDHGLEGNYCEAQHFTMQTPMLTVRPGYMGGICIGWDQHYFIHVENTAGRPLYDARITHDIPIHTHFYDANHGGIYDPETRQVTWHLGDLLDGAQWDLVLTLHISSAAVDGEHLEHLVTIYSQDIAYDQFELVETVRDCSQLPTSVPTLTATPTKRPPATPTTTRTKRPTATPSPTPTKIIPGSIQGLVWQDLDRDGQRDLAEPIFVGATVILDPKDAATRSEGQTMFCHTNQQGSYGFENLSPGTYILILVQRTGYFCSTVDILEIQLGQGERYLFNFGLAPLWHVFAPHLATS